MPETPSVNTGLPFEVEDRIDPTIITAHVGVPLVIELFRRMGAAQVVNAQVRIKQRQLVETLIALRVAAVQQSAPQRIATLEVDATILETHKRTAAVTYEGSRGYHPVVVVWAEQDLIVHDEFRDGNVPAGCGNVRILERAVAALPAGGEQIFVRGDSAWYEQEVLAWCEAPARAIGYAISADRSPHLRAAITRLPETAWQLECAEPDMIREWAEVPYVPEDGDHRKDRPCVRRYLAIRVRPRQRELFADGSTVKHVAIVTNREGDGLTLIRWHREKAGTVEHTHHVLKHELAAAALSSGKFGANAAWFRLNILPDNLLSALKRLAV